MHRYGNARTYAVDRCFHIGVVRQQRLSTRHSCHAHIAGQGGGERHPVRHVRGTSMSRVSSHLDGTTSRHDVMYFTMYDSCHRLLESTPETCAQQIAADRQTAIIRRPLSARYVGRPDQHTIQIRHSLLWPADVHAHFLAVYNITSGANRRRHCTRDLPGACTFQGAWCTCSHACRRSFENSKRLTTTLEAVCLSQGFLVLYNIRPDRAKHSRGL